MNTTQRLMATSMIVKDEDKVDLFFSLDENDKMESYLNMVSILLWSFCLPHDFEFCWVWSCLAHYHSQIAYFASFAFGIIHQVLLRLQNETQRVYPRILGHEAAGIVESAEEGVMDMKERDHVVPTFNGECGECVYCKCEKTNLCEKHRVNPFKSVMVNDGRTRFSTNKEGKKKPIFHFLNTIHCH
ncbi:hypothetical protein ACSBR2_010338 [Camellia fascicularis]